MLVNPSFLKANKSYFQPFRRIQPSKTAIGGLRAVCFEKDCTTDVENVELNTGPDGSYLSELLLGKHYEIHGIIRGSSSFKIGRIDHLFQDPHVWDRRLILHFRDLSDGASLVTLIGEIKPDGF